MASEELRVWAEFALVTTPPAIPHRVFAFRKELRGLNVVLRVVEVHFLVDVHILIAKEIIKIFYIYFFIFVYRDYLIIFRKLIDKFPFITIHD